MYNQADEDIIVPITRLEDAASNFHRVLNAITSSGINGKPYMRGIVRLLENQGQQAEANMIRREFLAILNKAEKLFQAIALMTVKAKL